MSKYRIAWLPGDGIGNDVMEAARIVLDALKLDAEYIHGDIGWEFWCKEGDAFPDRTIELLKNVDAALFGAITSKPVKAAEAELVPELKGKGLVYRSPIVRMRQLFDLYTCLRPCKAYPGNPLNYKEGIDLVVFRENTEDLYAGVEFYPVPRELAETLGTLSKPFAPLREAGAATSTPSPARSTRRRARSGSSAPRSSSRRSTAARRSRSSTRRTSSARPTASSSRRRRRSRGTTPRSSATRPTSTPSACGCSRTRSTTTCSWPRTCTATSSPTSARRWSAASASAARATSARSSPSSSRRTARRPKYAGQYKVEPDRDDPRREDDARLAGREGEGRAARGRGRPRSSRKARSAPTTWAALDARRWARPSPRRSADEPVAAGRR